MPTKLSGALALAAALLVAAPALAQQKALTQPGPSASPSPAPASPGPVDAERMKLARQLLIVQHSERNMMVALNQMKSIMLRGAIQANPGKDAEITAAMDEVVKRMGARTSEVLDLIAPIYAEKFSAAELKDIIAFMQSPTGSKMISVQPEILQRSMTAGAQWGQRIGAEVDREFKKELHNRGLKI